MNAHGFLYQPNSPSTSKDWINQPYTSTTHSTPARGKLFWSQIDTALFSKGVDAWWMDATEPDLMPSPPTLEGQQTHMNPTFLGTGSRMLNAYSLVNSEGVYTGQRQAAPNQRVFILTRSASRPAAHLRRPWSGDITSTWTAMAKQIPAGLGASISGLPYWTMDTGGYTMQRQVQPAAHDARQPGRVARTERALVPVLHLHPAPPRAWRTPPARDVDAGDDSPAFNAQLSFDRLRYGPLPYIYSLAG